MMQTRRTEASVLPALWPVILAVVVPLVACDNPTEPAPPQLEVVAGDRQEGQVRTVLDTPLTIRLIDGRGRPIAGVPVTWAGDANASDDFVVDADSVTGEDGRAQAGWRLGAGAGEQRLHVYAGDDAEHEFVATATPAETLWLDMDVEPGGPNVFGRHSLIIHSFDRWGNGFEGMSVDPTWTSSDSTVAFIDGEEIVMGSEGIARIAASGVAYGQEPRVSVHVRDGKALLMNAWTHVLPSITRKDPAAEGRPDRILAQGTASGPDTGTDIRQGFWEPIEGGFGVQGLTVRASIFGAGVEIFAGFRAVLFPVEPGDYTVGIMEGYDREGEEPLEFEPMWTFEVTVPD